VVLVELLVASQPPYHRPQWPVVTLWTVPNLSVVTVTTSPGDPALVEAADALRRESSGWSQDPVT
jgi:hypothetical protein